MRLPQSFIRTASISCGLFLGVVLVLVGGKRVDSPVVFPAAAAANEPAWSSLLAAEVRAVGHTQRLTVAMPCFWRGEAVLGGIEGVVATTPGFLNGREVVDAEFDPRLISIANLLKRAQDADVAEEVFARSDEQVPVAVACVGQAKVIRTDVAITPDGEPKHSLRLRTLRGVAMTPAQLCRVNAAVFFGNDPSPFLSPDQIAAGRALENRRADDVPVAEPLTIGR